MVIGTCILIASYFHAKIPSTQLSSTTFLHQTCLTLTQEPQPKFISELTLKGQRYGIGYAPYNRRSGGGVNLGRFVQQRIWVHFAQEEADIAV